MAAAAGARWAASQPAADPLDPVRAAGDTHKIAPRWNTFVRVLEVQSAAGQRSSRGTGIPTA